MDERELERELMRRALALAAMGWGQTAPNPMVGAVLVRDGVVVGEGYHARYGGDHAEVVALRAAGDRARGATMYVTLEPCAHHGQTPPCADALIAAGVARVVVAVGDPSPVARGGADKLRSAGTLVTVGVEESAARELNAPFFHAIGSDRPWVTLKLGVSLDGAIADAGGQSTWITNAASRAEAHRIRAANDAVAVGIGTVLADDPLLTVRDAPAPRVPPVRVVFDRAARLPLDSRLVRTAREIPLIVVVRAPEDERIAALRAVGATVIVSPGPANSLVQLRAKGIRALVVEGGARLAGVLLNEALVDRLIIFQSPRILGAGALGAFARTASRTAADAPRLAVIERRVFDDDIMTVYKCSPD